MTPKRPKKKSAKKAAKKAAKQEPVQSEPAKDKILEDYRQMWRKLAEALEPSKSNAEVNQEEFMKLWKQRQRERSPFPCRPCPCWLGCPYCNPQIIC